MGASLSWNPSEELKASWVSYILHDVSIANENDWDKMADFLGEWSNKIRNAVVPYLLEKYPQVTSALKSPEETKRLFLIAEILKNWMANNPNVEGHPEKSNRTCTRFTTTTMSQILPDISDALSGWNTDNHYFYEIVNRSGKDLIIQLSFSSKNITDNLRERLNQIDKFTPMHQRKIDWQWWKAYKSEKILVPEDLDQDLIFVQLDAAMDNIIEFEIDLKNKLGI